MLNLRNYKVKDVEMLMAAKTVSANFNENIDELSTVRANWNPEYAQELSGRINYAFDNYLGLDRKKELHEATKRLTDLQVPALRDLRFLKQQIEVDFKGEAKGIIKQLGYGDLLTKAGQGNQEALIQLLFAFRKGMDNALKELIVSQGTNPVLIDRIIAYADQILLANMTQESLKESTKELTQEAIAGLNEIYDEVIGICKISASYYQWDPVKKNQFTFAKIVANMNAASKAKAE